MPESTEEATDAATLSLIIDDSDDHSLADQPLSVLGARVSAAESRIAELDQRLEAASQQEAETAHQLDADHLHTVALSQELNEAREEVARLMHEEAISIRRNVVGEAEREAEAVLESGRLALEKLEVDTTQRVADLDAKHNSLARSLGEMESIYTELQSTLQLVAETSVKLLVETQESFRHPPSSEPEGAKSADLNDD